MRLKKIPAVLLLCLGLPVPAVLAADQVDPKAVTENLIEQLVKDGTLTREKADEILKKSSLNPNDPNKPPTENEVRIQYVPEAIKQKIRDDIRTNLQKDVVVDVLARPYRSNGASRACCRNGSIASNSPGIFACGRNAMIFPIPMRRHVVRPIYHAIQII